MGTARRLSGWLWRVAAKAAVGAVATLLILFPRVDRMMSQIGRLRNWDALIDAGHPALAAMNREIDARVAAGVTAAQEIAIVQEFVMRRIRYGYDWDVWGNVDYWPTVDELVAGGVEDCDGRAVLAASLLRSRGYSTARLVGNFSHMWVVIDPGDPRMGQAQPVALMSPVGRASFSREGGAVKVEIPGWADVRPGLQDLARFPAWRLAALAVVWLGLAFHPCRRWGWFGGILALAFFGLWMLQSWGARSSSPLGRAWDGELAVVGVCGLSAAVAAIAAHRVASRRG